MKLSTKGRYGLQVMIDLGVHAKENHISLKSIAGRLDISENYLEQLVARLKKHKLVGSKRGAQGGYFLAKDPLEISVGDILRALEGSLAPTDCTCEGKDYYCAHDGHCVTKTVWERIRDGINHVVDSMSLQDLIDDYEQLDTDNKTCNI
ncbi:MAG: RrF2 family transcriptional regulator [Cellulosilyticaceae bacterium]